MRDAGASGEVAADGEQQPRVEARRASGQELEIADGLGQAARPVVEAGTQLARQRPLRERRENAIELRSASASRAA